MKPKNMLFLVIGIAVILVTNGCSNDPTGPEELETIVAEETVVIPNNTGEEITQVTENEVILPLETNPEIYETGSVIVSAPTNAAPNGLLRKVAGHSVQGEQIVVTTERATLEDVFDQTEIHFERELKTTDIASTRILEDGIEFLRDGDNPVEFNYHIEKDFNLPDNVTVTLSGDISLEMGYDLNVRIRLFEGLDHVLSTAYVNQESELAMTVSEGFSLEEEVTLIEHDFLPITIPVLGIPVSFTPKVAILLEINASGEAAITTSVSTTSDIRVGLQYNKPEWSQTTQTDMDFDFSPPDIGELDVNINAFAGAGPRFDLMLYDSVGPFIKCIGYLDFEASIDADPWWTLYGGFSADAGVEFDAIGYEFDYTVEDVVDYKSILGQASSDQTVEAPTFEPPAGSYDSEVEVFLHCATNGAEIRFTTDGSLPTEASSLYSEPISITSTTTIKARAYLDLEDWLPSPVSSATYDMDGQPTVATPTFYPPGGTYDLPQSIIINCATSGSEIRYTMDGSEPTQSSNLYDGPIVVSSPTTIKARGFKPDWTPSEIASATYTSGVEPGGMVFVQGGTIYPSMGSYTGGLTAPSFYIGQFEVTQTEYSNVMGANPSYHDDVINGPVEQVNWFNAIEYCNRLSIEEGLSPCYSYLSYGTDPNEWPAGWDDDSEEAVNISWNQNADGYRLPTDAEWEFAARGGLDTHDYDYSGSNTLADVAWYDENSDETTHAVGQLAPNELGAYDMSGNVAEWCWDLVDDINASLRSGSFMTEAEDMYVWLQSYWFAEGSIGIIGFRVCRSAQ